MFANSNMMVRRLPSRAGREKLILGILQKKRGRSFSDGKDTLLQSGSDFISQLYAFWTKYHFAYRLPFSLDQPPAVGGFLRWTNISSPFPTNISFLVSRNISHHRLSKTAPPPAPDRY